DASSQNLISGNGGSGIVIQGAAAAGNVVQGNYIGTDIRGTSALGNLVSGIVIGQTTGATIGGTEPGAGNLISGNAHSGVTLTGNGHVVQGNFIGTDVTGLRALPNHGVSS